MTVDEYFKMSYSMLSCLITKRIICQFYYSKIDHRLRYIGVKDFSTELHCKKSLKSYPVFGKRHSKLFINCHISWDTLQVPLQQCNRMSKFLNTKHQMTCTQRYKREILIYDHGIWRTMYYTTGCPTKQDNSKTILKVVSDL